jgi:nucleotide-binding universal stress UspA family protein
LQATISDDLVALHQRWQTVKEHAFAMLEPHALKLGNQVGNSNITIEVVPGEPQHEILTTADEWYPDIIAMGTRQHAGMQRLFGNHVSAYVASRCHCSVLVINEWKGLGKDRSKKEKATTKSSRDDLKHELWTCDSMPHIPITM